MAARLGTELGQPVALEDGRTGEFTVMVDRIPVITRGLWVLFGLLPPYGRVLAAVRTALTRSG